MCVLSMVTDWGQKKWPEYKPSDFYTKTSWNGPTKEEWDNFVELVKKAIEYDKRNEEPKCIDPKKAKWLEEMSRIYDETMDKALVEAIKNLK